MAATLSPHASDEDGAAAKRYDRRLVRRLLVYVRPYRTLVAGALAAPDDRGAAAARRAHPDPAGHRRRAAERGHGARLAVGDALRRLAAAGVRVLVRRDDAHDAARPARDARPAATAVRARAAAVDRVLRPHSRRPARDTRDVRRRVAQRAVHRGCGRRAGRPVHSARDRRADDRDRLAARDRGVRGDPAGVSHVAPVPEARAHHLSRHPRAAGANQRLPPGAHHGDAHRSAVRTRASARASGSRRSTAAISTRT